MAEQRLSWLKQRTLIEKILILVLAVFIICNIALACKLIVTLSEGENHSVCVSPDCIKAASNILDTIDGTVNPCDDFYSFACGNFLKKSVIPDERTQVGITSHIYDHEMKQFRKLLQEPIKENDRKSVKLIKTIYKSCMNDTQIEQEGLSYFKNLFKTHGGWPVTDPHNWDEKNFDWIRLLYRFRKIGLRHNYFFSMYIGTDQKNSSKRILTISEACMTDRLRKGFNDTLTKAYYEYAVEIATIFGAERARASIEMRHVVDFEINLAKITTPKEDKQNSTLFYNPMRIGQLRQNITSIPWLEFINNYLASHETLTSYDYVNVASPRFLRELEDLLYRTNPKVLANYIFWTIARSSTYYLPEKIRNKNTEFMKVAYGVTSPSPRWEECSNSVYRCVRFMVVIERTITPTGTPLVSKLRISIGMAALYIQHFAKEYSKDKVIELVSDIKESFLETLQSTGWMDKITKEHALQKALKMDSFIGYPEELLDEDKVENEYKDLDLDPEAYFFELTLNMSLFNHKKYVKDLKKPIDKHDWKERTFVDAINAYYDDNDNSIEIPIGILQDPYFNEKCPQYLNYGAIGYVIGHEMTHGFDNGGRQYDKDGNLRDWWQPETNLTFSNKAQCLVDQYGNCTVPEIEANLNGLANLAENIADNGGIKLAYRGYNKWLERNHEEVTLPGLPYTPKQLFWISAARSFCTKYKNEYLKQFVTSGYHAPSRFRVLVPFMNSEYFAEDFKCPVGSPMNPTHKCKVW